MKITISVSAYNEIATILERNNIAPGTTELTLVKGTQLECSIDFRLAVMRRDCLIEAVKVFQVSQELDISELANKLFNFVAYGKTLSDQKDIQELINPAQNEGWK